MSSRVSSYPRSPGLQPGLQLGLQPLQAGSNDYDQAVQWARNRNQHQSVTNKDHSLFLFLIILVVVVILALVLWMYFRKPPVATVVGAITTSMTAPPAGATLAQLTDGRHQTTRQPPYLPPPPVFAPPALSGPPSRPNHGYNRFMDTATGQVLTAADFDNPNYSIIVEG